MQSEIALPPEVPQSFGIAAEAIAWSPAGSGYSGAKAWRGTLPDGRSLLIKRHAASIQSNRLAAAMHAQHAAAALPFVPRVWLGRDGSPVLTVGGFLWTACEWIDGNAAMPPSRAQVRAACQALAELHEVWRRDARASATIPAIDRRLALLRLPLPDETHPGTPALREALAAVRARVPPLAPVCCRLLENANRAGSSHFCHCDPHADHLLFHEQSVTGLIDFDAAKPDHPAVDLARYLGDAVGDHDELFHEGMQSYWKAGGTVAASAELVRLLDRSGTLCALLAWLHRPIPAPQADAVAARLQRMHERIESWPRSGFARLGNLLE